MGRQEGWKDINITWTEFSFFEDPQFFPFHSHLLVQLSFTLLLESNPILDI